MEKYVDLKNSCLSKEEKVKVMDMLYKYKEAFSLRDEIGTCPDIEVEIEVMEKSPFFIRLYLVREEDKAIIDKTGDKRVMPDFRHVNVRIAKNNVAYPLVKDTFSALGNL